MCLYVYTVQKIFYMALRFSSTKNKSWISYLLIVLAFVVLVCGIYLFFKFRIKAIEKGSKSAYQVNNKINSGQTGAFS